MRARRNRSKNFVLWLPIFAAVLVALYHSLSDDGAASILDHFGIAWRLPPSALPFVILVFAVASGTVSSVVEGKDWQTALAAAFTTAIAGVFGAVTQHAIVNRTLPKGAGMIFGLALALVLQACALFTPANLPKTEEVIKEELCIVEHAFVDDPTLDAVCNLLTPQQKATGHALAAAHRAKVGAQMKAMRAESCDAGAEAGK